MQGFCVAFALASLFVLAQCQATVNFARNVTTTAETGTPTNPEAGLNSIITFLLDYETPITLTCKDWGAPDCLTIPLQCPPGGVAYFDYESHLEYAPSYLFDITGDADGDSNGEDGEDGIPNYDPQAGPVGFLFLIADVTVTDITCLVQWKSQTINTISASQYTGSRTVPALEAIDPKGSVVKVNTAAPKVIDVIISWEANKAYSSDIGLTAVISLVVDQEVEFLEVEGTPPKLILSNLAVAKFMRVTTVTKPGGKMVSAIEFFYQTVPGEHSNGKFLTTKELDLGDTPVVGMNSNVLMNTKVDPKLLQFRRITLTTTKLLFPPNTYDNATLPILPLDFVAPTTKRAVPSNLLVKGSVGVSLKVVMNDIWSINERSQQFDFDLTYILTWYDHQLDIPGAGLRVYKAAPPRIWLPEVILWTARGRIRPFTSYLTISGGVVTWIRKIQSQNSWYIRPKDFPFDIQTMQFQWRQGYSANGNFTWVVHTSTEAEQAELENLYDPQFQFYDLQQEAQTIESTQTNNTRILVTAFFAQRRATVSGLLIMIPITLLLFAVYLTFYYPLKILSRLTIPIYATLGIAAFSVVVSNVLPATGSVTRLVLYIILAFIYITLVAIPQVFLVLITQLCEDMEKDFKFAKKKETWDAKGAKGGGAVKNHVGELGKSFLWFWVVTPSNMEEYFEKLEKVNQIFRVTHIFILMAFLAPVYLLPSTVPQPFELYEPYVNAEGTDPFRYDIAKTAYGVYTAIVGFVFVATLLCWLLFNKKASQSRSGLNEDLL